MFYCLKLVSRKRQLMECCNKVANALYWWGCEFRLRAVKVLSKCFVYSVAGNARRVLVLIDFIVHSNATVKLALIHIM